jgi:hypothetical protein
VKQIPEQSTASLTTSADSKVHEIGEDIKRAIECSFKPFRCVVQISPAGQMQFTVMMKRTQPIYTEPGIPLEVLGDIDGITQLLFSVRRLLETKGYQIHPLVWKTGPDAE